MQQITGYGFSKHTSRPTILKIYQPSTKTWIVKLQNADTDATELYKTDLNNTPEPCLLYTSPSPRDRTRSRMPSSA